MAMRNMKIAVLAVIVGTSVVMAQSASVSPPSSQPTSQPTTRKSGIDNAADAYCADSTRQLLSIGAKVQYTRVHGSFRMTGQNVSGNYVYENAPVKGGDFDGSSKTEPPFNGTWKFDAASDLKDLKIEIQTGATFVLEGKKFQYGDKGWVELTEPKN